MNRMVRFVARGAAGVWALALLVTSCGDGTSPAVVRPTSDLHFIQRAPDAPEFADTTVTFWVKNNVDNEIRVRFAPLAGSTQNEDYVRFRVRAGSLARYPDGRPFGPTDSVLITLRVVDFAHMIVDFQPSGLRFSTARPARLTFEYNHANHDFDGDGDIDADDARDETLLSVWRQEAGDQPWLKVPSALSVDLDEVEADITGFTGYALAY